MTERGNYVGYLDMLGVGDASTDESEAYHDQLLRFRQAVCDAVDTELDSSDRVFAFSDCAFVSSHSISRTCGFISTVQSRLWEHSLFIKGAIASSNLECNDFAALPNQSVELICERSEKLSGYWFSKDFVQPALVEKNLKGIAIQIGRDLESDPWLSKKTAYSAYFTGDSLRKPTVILDLLVPEKSLRLLSSILKQYLIVSHTSRRHSRYYIPLLITWINSHNFEETVYDAGGSTYELPLRQMTVSRRVASEIVQLPGGDLIYYALLSKVGQECQDERVIEKLIEFFGSSKRLRAAAEFVPTQICASSLCRRVNETRIRQLFA